MSSAAPGHLEIRNLSKTYFLNGHAVEALRSINLDIGQGELLSVTGASGAGKSTLLHVLGTLDAPTAGTVRYDGEDVFARNAADLATYRNRHIGFVFQFHHLLREFTAVENVMIPMLIQRAGFEQAREKATAILKRVGLGERLEHKPGELSGGEQQRVALARALILEPKLLLADEPTGNLDEATAEGIHQLIFEMNEELRITVVVVTHNQSLADRMPRRLQMADGRIESSG